MKSRRLQLKRRNLCLQSTGALHLLPNMVAANTVSSGDGKGGFAGARAHCRLPPSVHTQAPYVTGGMGSGGIWAAEERKKMREGGTEEKETDAVLAFRGLTHSSR